MARGRNQGISSNKLVHKPVRTGQPAKGRNPGHVAQLGNHVGDHITNRSATNYRGEPKFTQAPVNAGQRLGNEVAKSTQCGPGGSRTVYAQGTQQSGAVRPMGSTRDILAEYGPDSAGVAGRK